MSDAHVTVEPLPDYNFEDWFPGQLVRVVQTPQTKKIPDVLYVVLADKGQRINVTRVGGDQGRYWRIPPKLLTKVNPEDVLR